MEKGLWIGGRARFEVSRSPANCGSEYATVGSGSSRAHAHHWTSNRFHGAAVQHHLWGVQRMPIAPAALAPTLPSEAEAILAKETGRVLASHMRAAEPLNFQIGPALEDSVRVPASALRMLVRILEEMAKGNAVTLIPVHAELTTQEAADMLNISRPSLIQLLDEGRIDYRKVGTHRRVRFEALIKFKRQADADRKAALAEFVAYDQELGI